MGTPPLQGPQRINWRQRCCLKMQIINMVIIENSITKITSDKWTVKDKKKWNNYIKYFSFAFFVWSYRFILLNILKSLSFPFSIKIMYFQLIRVEIIINAFNKCFRLPWSIKKTQFPHLALFCVNFCCTVQQHMICCAQLLPLNQVFTRWQ